MPILKCKMCGGDLKIMPGQTTCKCEYCGCVQTLPRLDDDRKANLYDRANHFRRNNDFDKASAVYERLLSEDPGDAEAYWSLVLCRYGIEYVEDPATHRRVPTVNRAQYTSVFDDDNYKQAIAYADSEQRQLYEQEAKVINEIQKGILAISQKEEPFDVFICYKETNATGRRTMDSVLANDLYHQLTQEGFKVFFSRITLEDKLGVAYEPYIFAALNSAKVMVVLGTRPEYFNAVWVKNEWSRYLTIVKESGGKKVLIPAYRDMDPYDLPEEFSHLQAQDMSKLGFMQDLIRGIKKLTATETAKPAVTEPLVIHQGAAGTTAGAQVKRGNMALEDHDWAKADDFFEEALNLDPECAEAYLGKLLAREKKPGLTSWLVMQKEKYSSFTTERLEACPEETEHIAKKAAECVLTGYLDESTIKKGYKFERGYDSALSCRKNQKAKQLAELQSDRLLRRVKQYEKGSTQKQIEDALAEITAVLDKRITDAQAEDEASISRVKAAYAAHIAAADQKADELNVDARSRQEQDYQNAVGAMKAADDVFAYETAKRALKAMNGYKDSDALASKCQQEIDRLHEEEQQERQERERQAAIQRKTVAREKRRRIIINVIVTAVALVCAVALVVVPRVVIRNNKYNAAVALMEAGRYKEAIAVFETMEGYKDSAEKEAEIFDQFKLEKLKAAEVGDSVFFGNFEQNNMSDGKEDIEWIILAKENEKALVISRYALDCQAYNSSYTNATWETCSLRTWLNETFLYTAFSPNEQAMIAMTNVAADNNPESNTNPGNAVDDKVFLLSITEAEKYFTNAESRMCAPTAYAEARESYASNNYKTASGKGTYYWWLRSPGIEQYYAAYVYDFGVVCSRGRYIPDHGCVRPALWITLDA